MSYPGNPSLSTAVKDRVVSTFRQTLSLFKQGRNEEVASGCTLILQMDPLFDPARKLLDKARNPSLPIDVDQLLPAGAGPDSMQQAREAMAARDFQRVVQITTEVLTDDLMNDEARVLSDEARDKMEAAPFVDQFVRKAEQHVSAGNPSAARAELEKARALDATHPEIIRLSRSLEAQAPAAPMSFDATPSFIVDEPAPPPAAAGGRSTAQASDFGFTFEEEKATPAPPAAPAAPAGGFGGFSFDTPAAAASPFAPAASADAPFANFSFDAPATGSAAPGDFDFATAAINTSPDDQRKIEQYLADGDRAYDAGEFQQAIDLWSRIFLIDVTNDSASERIERAKGRRREIEQRVDAHVAAGIQAFDRKERERSRAEFAEALRLDPNQETARDYMERLAAAAALGSAADIADAPYVAPEPMADLDMFDEPDTGVEAPLVPPDDAAEPARPKKAAAERPAPARTEKRALPMTAILGLLGVLVLAAGGWFVWNKFMGGTDANPAATQALFAQASNLAKRGEYDKAIAVLQDVQPDDPEHDRALEMIADLQQRKSQATQLINGKKPDVYFGEQLALAQTALASHDYVGAKAAYEQAMRVKPLPPELKSSYDTASQQVAKLDAAKALFAERKYPEAIANLQPLLEQDPQNRNIQRMISDAHFNLGAAALQEERIPDAIREFEEVLKVDPNDELARRSRDLAQRYEGQTKDLLYRIYVKYLPQRQAG